MSNEQTKPVLSGSSDLVKVRVKHGRLVIPNSSNSYNSDGTAQKGRDGDDLFAEAGEVVEVDRKWAERLLKRKFDGYPPTPQSFGAPGQLPGVICDSPIEIVNE